jgi:hypothetical protein
MTSLQQASIRSYLNFLVIVIVCVGSVHAQSVYFVGPNGSARNSGRVVTAPLHSITSAIDLASAGDTIYVLPGTYKEVIRVKNKNGAPEHKICVLGHANTLDQYPVIDGGVEQPTKEPIGSWITVDSSSWIEFGRMKFVNAWAFPVKIENSSYISFIENRFWGGKRVINVGGRLSHHILVEKCFWDQGGALLWTIAKDTTGMDAWTSMHHGTMSYYNGSLIDFNGTGGSIVIRNNTIVNAYNAIRFRGRKGYDSNIEIYDNSVLNIRDNDFEPEYYTYNLHIYHNRSHNIHRTLSIDNVEGGQIYYYGNIVTSDTDPWSLEICRGLWKVINGERRSSYPLYAFNNSFLSSGTAFAATRGKVMNIHHHNNAYFFRNDDAWYLHEWDSTDTFDYDISNKPWPASLTQNQQESHGRIADMKFADAAKNDVHLESGSPGIDAGKILSLKEFDWVQAYEGLAPDVGAYENGKLVVGPPFRFLPSPDSGCAYQEKPRIVRCEIVEKRVNLYFSSELDAGSIAKGSVEVFLAGKQIPVRGMTFPRNNFTLMIKTDSSLRTEGLSIRFKELPRGLNGEPVTLWGAPSGFVYAPEKK